MKAWWAVGGLIAAMAAAGLAGCAADPGTAATVRGEAIPERAVVTLVEDYQDQLGLRMGSEPALRLLILDKLATPVAAQYGVELSDQEIDEQWQQVFVANDPSYQIPAETPAQTEQMRAAMRGALLTNPTYYLQVSSQPLTIDKVEELFGEIQENLEQEVKINPRYGEVSSQEVVVAKTYPWIATPQAEEMPLIPPPGSGSPEAQ